MLDFWKRVRNLLQGDLTQSWLCNEIEVSSGTLSNWINKNRYPGADKAQAIACALNVSVEFLVSGEETCNSQEEYTPPVTLSENRGVPYYEIDATAHITSSFEDVLETPSFFIDFLPFNDCYAYINVYGNSMFPKYANGEIIAIQRKKNFNVILWGEAHLVITDDSADSLRTIKLLYPGEDNDHIVLRSSNPSYKGDTVIEKSSILQLYLVRGKITREQL